MILNKLTNTVLTEWGTLQEKQREKEDFACVYEKPHYGGSGGCTEEEEEVYA